MINLELILLGLGLSFVTPVFANYDSFQEHLSQQNYSEAIRSLREQRYVLDLAQTDIVKECKKVDPKACENLLSLFFSLWVEDEHQAIDSLFWAEQSDDLFFKVVNVWQKISKINLRSELAALLTFPEFNLEKLQYIVSKLEHFDSSSKPKPNSSSSFLSSAERLNRRPEVIAFLKAYSHTKDSPNPSAEVDYSRYASIPHLAELTRTAPIVSPPPGEFVKLTQAEQLSGLLSDIGMLRISKSEIDKNIDYLMNIDSCDRTKANLAFFDHWKKTVVDRFILLKSLIPGQVEFYYTHHLQIDRAVAKGHGIHKVGTIHFKSNTYVYKESGTDPSSLNILETVDFIEKVIKLGQSNSHIVQVLPIVILNQIGPKALEVGYLMKKVDGKTLRDISALSLDEKKNFQIQFNRAVELMNQGGYGLHDFNDDNLMWDGKHLTLIDLNPLGFKHQDFSYTEDAKYLVGQWLKTK